MALTVSHLVHPYDFTYQIPFPGVRNCLVKPRLPDLVKMKFSLLLLPAAFSAVYGTQFMDRRADKHCAPGNNCQRGVGGTNGVKPPLTSRMADCSKLNTVTVSPYTMYVLMIAQPALSCPPCLLSAASIARAHRKLTGVHQHYDLHGDGSRKSADPDGPARGSSAAEAPGRRRHHHRADRGPDLRHVLQVGLGLLQRLLVRRRHRRDHDAADTDVVHVDHDRQHLPCQEGCQEGCRRVRLRDGRGL